MVHERRISTKGIKIEYSIDTRMDDVFLRLMIEGLDPDDPNYNTTRWKLMHEFIFPDVAKTLNKAIVKELQFGISYAEVWKYYPEGATEFIKEDRKNTLPGD